MLVLKSPNPFERFAPGLVFNLLSFDMLKSLPSGLLLLLQVACSSFSISLVFSEISTLFERFASRLF